MNYYLETHRGRLPLEFTLLNYSPRPWRIEDTLLAALQMYRMLTTSWPEEIRKLHMLEKGDAQKVEFLYPGAHRNRSGSGIERLGDFRRAHRQRQAHSGGRSASGMVHPVALVPGASQSAPADLDVTGASLPGIPAVILGHNRRIAWSVTNLEFDVQDLYREQIDPQTGRYQVNGQTAAGRAGARLDRREGTEAVAIGHLDHRARTGVSER